MKIKMLADAGNVNQVVDQTAAKLKELVAAMGKGSAKIPPVIPPGGGGGGGITPPPEALTGWGKLSGIIGGTGAKVAGVVAVVGAAVVAIKAVASAVEPFIKLNSEIEDTQLRFKVLIGDAAKAKEAFAETKKYADATPFTLREASAARAKLYTAGLEDLDSLKAAGNLSAASGRPLEEVAAAFARLKSGATGEAMEALRNMNISQSMFEAKGINFDKGGQALATAQEMMTALNGIVNSNFNGMTDELAKNWNGLWSTFSDTVDSSMRAVSGGGFVWLKSTISSITFALNEILKGERLQQFGNAIGSLFGSIVGMGKSLLSALGPIGGIIGVTLVKALGVAAGIIATIGMGINLIANSTQLVMDLVSGGGKGAIQQAQLRQREIIGDYKVQMKQAGAAVMGTSYELENNTEAINKNAKAANKATIDAIGDRKQTEISISRVLALQETAWAVDKAKGRDAVQLAQMEAEQAKVNLDAILASDEAVRSAREAEGTKHEKSAALMGAEASYAKALENYYDKAIAKKETMGEFITNTSKLMAEAEGIDKRGGDSGVKRYEALKSAAEEYLDTLKKLRDNQNQTATGSEKMQAATDAAQSGNLSQYQNLSAAIEQNEKIFNIQALQERLQQIQQLSQAQNLGARERFSLYEQERQVFAEVTNGISGAIEDTMQKIESMQGKAMGAASSAMGILDKIGASSSAYSQVGNMIRSMNLDTGNMSLQNLGQMASIADQLKKKGVRSSDLMPRSSEVLSALQKELSGVPESISKLQTGLQSLIGLSTQIGAEAANNFWKPWETKLDQLKAQFGNLAMANLNPANSLMPPVQIPQGTAGGAGGKTVNVNAQTNLQVQGSTLKEVNDVVTKAKDRFGEELFAALQEANTLYGF